MNTDLERRLRDLAAQAPPSLPVDGLWGRGVRRRRTRRLAGVAGSVVVLMAIAGGVQVGRSLVNDEALPAAPATGTGHLPRTIPVPAPWSEGTEKAGELGALSVLGYADRKRAKGLTGMVAYEGLYGISAVDGTARFLDLPTSEAQDMPGRSLPDASLSPDGRKISFPRYDWVREDTTDPAEVLIGWSVYDTVTGEVVELGDPAAPRLGDSGMVPIFSSDSKYLLTVYAPEGAYDPRKDSFVAWDVATGARYLVEGPGKYWQPNVGSGPQGIVWSRGKTTYTYDPSTRTTSSIQTEHDPVAASFAPRGTGFAYVGGRLTEEGINAPWQLYVGASPDQMQRVSGIADYNGILGWRDSEHVVVAITDRDYGIVDVSDGSVDRGSFDGDVNLNVAMLAADLWANDLVSGARPSGASDPRTPGRLAALGGVLVAGAVFTLWRRRLRHG